jgi:hypothetical protein
VLAVVLAFANGFVVVAIQGAIGAIERAQTPFANWLLYSSLMVPVFALVVMSVLARARRRGRRTVTTVLFIAAAATLVGLAALIVSTALDYHLQSALLAKTAGLHVHGTGPGDAGNQAYSDGLWSPEQRLTILIEVKGIGFATPLLAAVNLFFAGWVTALLGGRLQARGSKQPASDPTPR